MFRWFACITLVLCALCASVAQQSAGRATDVSADGETLADRDRFDPANRKPWPPKIIAPKGMEASPGPWNDPADATVWPNTASRANSDTRLVDNHDAIKVMRP